MIKLAEAGDGIFKDTMEKVGMAKNPIHVCQFRNTLLELMKDPGKPCFFYFKFITEIFCQKKTIMISTSGKTKITGSGPLLQSITKIF